MCLVRSRPCLHLTTGTFVPPNKQGHLLRLSCYSKHKWQTFISSEKRTPVRRAKHSCWANACSYSVLFTPCLQLVFLSGKIKVQKIQQATRWLLVASWSGVPISFDVSVGLPMAKAPWRVNPSTATSRTSLMSILRSFMLWDLGVLMAAQVFPAFSSCPCVFGELGDCLPGTES